MCGDGNFSLLVYYGEDFALLGEFLCPRRQRNQNAAGDGGRESAEKISGGGIFSALLCRLSPDPYYGRAGGLALISARKICERSHRLLLRKMQRILRGISNTARLDGGKD